MNVVEIAECFSSLRDHDGDDDGIDIEFYNDIISELCDEVDYVMFQNYTGLDKV